MSLHFPVKTPWVHDIEIYPNYLLIGFKNTVSKKVVSWEVEGEKGVLNEDDADEIRSFLECHRTVGFNSKPFDLPLVYAAIEGWSVRKLKGMADDIILGDARPWDLEKAYGFKVPRFLDHIDLIEVAPGKASLKIYNGRLHGRRMQDLPIPPDAILTKEDMEVVYDYWKNDLEATELLFSSLKDQIDLRTQMSEEYGVDIRSRSDAQVAETVIKKQVAKIVGYEPSRPDIEPGTSYRYKIPEYMRGATHPALLAVLDEIEGSEFKVFHKTGKIIMPQALKDAEIAIGEGVYRMGIGGLHSSEKCQAIVAGPDEILLDRDATSFYPYIILNQGLFPKHLGWAFLKVYKKIVLRRIKAKNDAALTQNEIKDLESGLAGSNGSGELLRERIEELNKVLKTLVAVTESLKITINGSFGKFGNQWSVLYSPDLLIQTTISGQLSLLLLIDWLDKAGIRVVSANTDGIVILCKKKDEQKMARIVARWEKETGFGTEATEYSAIYSRDVNNYIAVYKKPKKATEPCKTKGAYAKAGFQKNPQTEICTWAAIQHIVNGTPLSKTIRQSKDIRQFVTVRTVKGGAVWGVDEVEVERISEKTGRKLKSGVEYDMRRAEFLGKAIRWYYSTNGKGHIHYKANGYTVPRSFGAKPCMELPDTFPNDIDLTWYIRESRKILQEIGFTSSLI